MKLLYSQRNVATIFDLLGDKENDMTFSLGWVLSASTAFLGALISDITAHPWEHVADALVRLQTGRVELGITDVEVELPANLAIIFEAKRGPQLPSIEQLAKYARVLRANHAPEKHLVAVTNATANYAAIALPQHIEGIRLHHRSWRDLKVLAERAAAQEGHANKRWIREFVRYLEGLLEMETRYSNLTYVVSLAAGNPKGWGISWIDIVVNRRRYFYWIGRSGWPDPPPNYIAFRYSGKLQSIHHVDSFDIMTDPHSVFPEAPAQKWDPAYCLNLGPPISPPKDVKAGPRVKWAARRWCMIDTLLTSDTISDALTETERRKNETS